MRKPVDIQGSVRADLVGGTLDLFPLNFQIPDVVTVNIALSLKAKVQIQETQEPHVVIESLDYGYTYTFNKCDFTKDKLFFSDFFGKMTFIAQILYHCQSISHLKITLSSGAPAGSGLGGSSSMGVVLYKAIKHFMQESFDKITAIKEVQQLEAGILNAGVAGYQDYYPAMFGGVLALHPKIGSEEVEQLASEELNDFLESSMTLVFSGVSRDSGINNWEVYKKFYDKDPLIVQGLHQIAQISQKAYQAILSKNYKELLGLIIEEGEQRSRLFPNILGPKITQIKNDLESKKLIDGIKICGAGGGGCFLLIHPNTSRDSLVPILNQYQMKVLELKVAEVLQ